MLIELSKSIGQLIFVALLGGAVSFVYDQYFKEEEHRKNKLAEDTKNRRELLDALIDEYETNIEKIDRQSDGDAIKTIQELNKFGTFITGDGGMEYTQKYLADYRRSATLMRQYIVEPKNLT